jgi:ElaB/YqjD/DUF883 family membrane-anchored ribosome-binding protein
MAPDESTRLQTPREIERELEESRESAARLRDSLAQKLGIRSAVRNATSGVQRAAHYVQVHSVKDMATGFERLVLRRPATSVAAAVIAGFLVGRALRSR